MPSQMDVELWCSEWVGWMDVLDWITQGGVRYRALYGAYNLTRKQTKTIHWVISSLHNWNFQQPGGRLHWWQTTGMEGDRWRPASFAKERTESCYGWQHHFCLRWLGADYLRWWRQLSRHLVLGSYHGVLARGWHAGCGQKLPCSSCSASIYHRIRVFSNAFNIICHLF